MEGIPRKGHPVCETPRSRQRNQRSELFLGDSEWKNGKSLKKKNKKARNEGKNIRNRHEGQKSSDWIQRGEERPDRGNSLYPMIRRFRKRLILDKNCVSGVAKETKGRGGFLAWDEER